MSLPAEAAARLAAICEPYDVAPAGRTALARFLEILDEDPHAPTTVREHRLAVDRHVGDALSGLAVPELDRARVIADLGAGAGVPALVLAAARPHARVFALESANRKCAFLRRAADAMGLVNVEVVHARAEEWGAGIARCEAATARALAPLSVVVEYAAPLLAPGGALVAWKGAPAPREVADGDAAARMLGLSPGRATVPDSASPAGARLYVYLKVGSLPNGYPRRPGMARKRPIRAST